MHNFTSFAFMVGLVLIVAILFKDNLPERVDIDWLKQGGGFIKSKHAPAGRFNAGEKLVYLAFPGGRRRGLGVGVSAAVSRSTGPISPTCSSRRWCTPSSPFCSSP